MIYWLIYDIGNNRVRGIVARICREYGMFRVQKSSFIGNLSTNTAEMLAIELKEMFENKGGDAIFLIPTCSSCSNKKIILGKLDNEKLKKRGFFVIR